MKPISGPALPHPLRASLLLAAVLFLAACKTATLAPAAPSAASQDYAAIVTTLAAPDMEGRGPGTAGINKAKAYLESLYAAAGLQPGVRPAGKPPTFEDPFEIKTVARSVAGEIHLVSDNKSLNPDLRLYLQGYRGKDFNPLGFSANGTFEGQLAFVGYAIVSPSHHYDNFGNGDEKSLAGKIAVAFRYQPMAEPGKSKWGPNGAWTEEAALSNKAIQAERHGAVALLIVNPPGADTPGLMTTAGTDYPLPIKIPVMHISSDFFQRLLVFAGRADAAKDLQKAADAGADNPVTFNVTLHGDVELERKPATVANIVGLLPGAGPLADQYVVVGAHYDHLGYGDSGSLYHPGPKDPPNPIHPGADDNASGTAGVVLIARELASLVHDGVAPANRRSVLFVAFTAEERGLLGSAHMLAHLADLGLKQEQISEMINLDMIGRMKDQTVYATGETSAQPWKDLVKQAGEGSDLNIVPESLLLGGSDHMSFHRYHIPAVHFYTGLHADYHRPTDTAEKINAVGGQAVAHVAANLAQLVWATPEPITFDPRGAEVRGVGARGAFLGVQFDPDALTKTGPVYVASTVPASPAAAAGLEPGDLITAFDDKKINSLNDLLAAMQSAHIGQAVKLTIQRGKETLTLTATLAGN